MGILFAVIAYGILALSLTLDKVILKRRVQGSSITYIFWIGAANVLVLPLVLLGFAPPEPLTAALGILAGALMLVASRFYFGALERGEATQSPVIVGAFTPIFAAVWSVLLISGSLNPAEKVSFVLLVAGGIIMFISKPSEVQRILPWALAASAFYGAANVVQKMVFIQTSFINGLILFSFGMVMGAALLLLRTSWRKEIFKRSEESTAGRRTLYIFNRVLAAAGTLLLYYAIKLEHPALIDSIAGVRAAGVFLLVFAITKIKPGILREHFRGRELAGKVAATFIIGLGLFGIGFERYYQSQPFPAKTIWGLTFSEFQSKALDLDWKENYAAILRELHPKEIRLVAYWEYLEPENNNFDFADMDYQMEEAGRSGSQVVLAIGQKVPRWAECHYPGWLNKNDKAERDAELLEYLAESVKHFRTAPGLYMWQVENEPFLDFGECPPPDPELISKEVALVRSLDPSHPILMTDGGEFGRWFQAAQLGDVFGSTMYRKVHSDTFGYFTYPLTPEYFGMKRSIVRFLTGKPDQRYIIVELALEPWIEKQFYETPVAEQLARFNERDFADTLDYARRAKFDTYYAWGVEWWYWMKAKQGDDRFWELGKRIFNQ